MENKMIGGISIERWKEAFAELVNIAISKDYFSDILFFDLYPNTHDEANAIDEDDEEAVCDIYNEKWNYVDEAYEAIFGVRRYN
jgi:hypothetical protein